MFALFSFMVGEVGDWKIVSISIKSQTSTHYIVVISVIVFTVINQEEEFKQKHQQVKSQHQTESHRLKSRLEEQRVRKLRLNSSACFYMWFILKKVKWENIIAEFLYLVRYIKCGRDKYIILQNTVESMIFYYILRNFFKNSFQLLIKI